MILYEVRGQTDRLFSMSANVGSNSAILEFFDRNGMTAVSFFRGHHPV